MYQVLFMYSDVSVLVLVCVQAVAKGAVLPKEDRFDSNCITPGTEFMARLHEQLKYFVNKKLATDPAWQRVDVILSGHCVSVQDVVYCMCFPFPCSQPCCGLVMIYSVVPHPNAVCVCNYYLIFFDTGTCMNVFRARALL